MNNQLIQEYATLAEIAYKEYNANGEQNPIVDALTMKGQNIKYNVLYATPHTTENGFQAVLYGIRTPDENGKYEKVCRMW